MKNAVVMETASEATFLNFDCEGIVLIIRQYFGNLTEMSLDIVDFSMQNKIWVQVLSGDRKM